MRVRERRRLRLEMRALLIVLVASTGCGLYFGGPHGDDDICPAAGAPQALRDPQNGACESFGGGCRGIPDPDWAACGSPCEILDEGTCSRTAACRPIYTGAVCPPNADCKVGTTVTFLACWPTAPSGPVHGGDCWQEDAYGCSQHDDCAAVYTRLATSLSFASCMPEPLALDPGTCDGQVLCRAAPPACPTGTVPGVRDGCWSGYCIPTSDCGPKDPGTCNGQAVCQSLPPACPPGTVPGVRDGCWSGYCIPTAACPA